MQNLLLRRARHAAETLGHRLRHVVPGTAHGIGPVEGAQPFFIISSGRAGTTLLRRILCAGGTVHIPREVTLLPIIRYYRQNATLPWRTLTHLVLAYFEYRRDFEYTLAPVARELRRVPKKARTLATILDAIYRYDGSVQGVDATRWGDKTPMNYECVDEIRAMFPDATFVHMYRDGCDVVASYIEHFWDDPKRCAQRWVESFEFARRCQAKYPGAYTEVRYEDLVAEPESTTRALCDRLGIEFDPAMLSRTTRDMNSMEDARTQADFRGNTLHGDIDAPITRKSIGRGRTELTPEQLEMIAPIIDPLLAELGYEPCRAAGSNA